jgi:hypothetical protein
VLDQKQKPLLQSWAIVDNTPQMDWTDVTLSLVAGAPISFVQNLSQPPLNFGHDVDASAAAVFVEASRRTGKRVFRQGVNCG